MLSLSNKAQFFILSSVMIVGVFFTLSKYINQYSFIDTSEAAEGAEIFMFDNIKDKAIKTVQISNLGNIQGRLETYKSFSEKIVADRGYTLVFNYTIKPYDTPPMALFNMTLMSKKYTLSSTFSEPIPPT